MNLGHISKSKEIYIKTITTIIFTKYNTSQTRI